MKTQAALVMLSLAGVALAAQSDPLSAARDLYASAAYEEALSELARVDKDASPPTVASELDAYRAFCLVALGRAHEAEAVVESLVRKDPMLTVDQYRDASPRIATLFAAVRKRMLPELIRAEYRAARTPLAEKASDSESRLIHVRQMLIEAQKIGAWDDTLEDLRTLVDGFLELSRASAPPTVPAPAPPQSSSATSEGSSTPSAPRAAFHAEDTGIVAPIVVSQPAPYVPPDLLNAVRRSHLVGKIEVVIDEHGSVEDVRVTQSVNPAYDARIVAAARNWKYRPAMKDGVPVTFVKTVVVNAQ